MYEAYFIVTAEWKRLGEQAQEMVHVCSLGCVNPVYEAVFLSPFISFAQFTCSICKPEARFILKLGAWAQSLIPGLHIDSPGL